ncbi:MAG: GTP-dependent dephospho-CoA kinase family protein [Thermoplasmata archaeon]
MQLKPDECYYLPDELRDELSKAQGKVYTRIEDILNDYSNRRIVTVGDFVTYLFLDFKLIPFLSIFDLKTKRKVSENKLLDFFHHRLVVYNPPGCITYSLINSIIYAANEGINAIQVVGEEDLASLISIILLDNVIIIYGIPNIGMSIIETNEIWKNKAQKIIDRMVIKKWN